MRGLHSDMGFWGERLNLHEIIQQAGATSGLKLCLDAGAAASFPGSGQQWLDLSGTGTDFYLGDAATTDSTDPTFHGAAGGLTDQEYFGCDGGDYFTIVSSPTWMNSIHQDGAQWGALVVWYNTGDDGFQGMFGTNGFSTAWVGFGVGLYLNKLVMGVERGVNGSPALSVNSDTALGVGWHISFISIDEPGAVGFFADNGAYVPVGGVNTFNATYAGPSASASTYPCQIAATGAHGYPAVNGTHHAGVALWQGVAPSKIQYDAIYAILRERFGL